MFPHPTEHSRPKEHFETDIQTVQLLGKRQKLREVLKSDIGRTRAAISC